MMDLIRTYPNLSQLKGCALPPAAQQIGYVRMSTADQQPETQEAALQEAGCSQAFTARSSAAAKPTVPSGPPLCPLCSRL